MSQTFINLTINLRKLGQISSPFFILYKCAKQREGGYEMIGIRTQVTFDFCISAHKAAQVLV